MPTRIESELRAVQHSIAEIKRQMKETVNVKHHKKMKETLEMYYEEEERLLNRMRYI